MKIAYKLLIIVISTSIVSISLLSFLIFNLAKSSISASIESQQLQLAQQTMDKIDRLLHERYTDMQSIAGDELIEHTLMNIDQNITNDESESNFLEFIERIKDLSIVTGPWDDIDVLSLNGDVVYSIDPKAIGENIQDEPINHELFNQALKGNVVYSDAILDPGTKKPTLIFATPIHNIDDPGKKIVGVVITHLSWPVVSEILESIKGPTIDLYNSHGLEIANNDAPEDVFNVNNGNHPDVKSALEGKEQSQVSIGVDGEETVSSSAVEKGFLGYKGNKWVILIEQPTSEAFAPAISSATKIVLLLTSMIIASSGLILFLVLRLLKPIELITQTSKEIAAGDLSKRVNISSKDEIGHLAVSFNIMADKLQSLYQGLEQKVAEKTTQLAQKLQELEREKSKDEAILGSIGEGMLVTDNQGRLLVINKIASEMLGVIDPDLIQNKSIFETFVFYSQDGKPIPLQQRPGYLALQTKQKIEELYEYHLPDGSKLQINVSANPIILQGLIGGVIMIIRDVTKEKAVDRMKTEFISLASHQLRTPLSAIKWFTEMLLSGDAGPLQPEQLDFTKNISESTERMIQLVNSLLNISRIESGRIVIDPKPTDLKELVSGIVNDLKAKTQQRQQNLIISVHEGLPQINIDPRLIGQVYMNLLTNAIKYTPKGGDITVFISRKGEEIISQVSDSGYGIPKNQQARVFQKFFRADNIIKVETDGTGLGLYLIKSIIDSSGGKIWFTSEENKGTSFWFSLPMTGMIAKAGDVTLDG